MAARTLIQETEAPQLGGNILMRKRTTVADGQGSIMGLTLELPGQNCSPSCSADSIAN